MAVYGRSKPYNDRKQCERCGIEPETRKAHRSGYCTDCALPARQAGWTN